MSLSGTVLPVAMIVIGVAMVARAVGEGGGALAVGVLLGVLFTAAGALRLYVERRSRR